MARLILLNGPPGVGKSTLARRYTDHHPLTLDLDIDVVRSLLGPVEGDVSRSWFAARALALTMATTHLGAGHDVVVPQYLGRPEFIDQLGAASAETDARFVHVVLVIGAESGRARFDLRGHVPQLAGATEGWSQMHERLHVLLAGRVDVVRVDASGDVDDTFGRLTTALAGTASG